MKKPVLSLVAAALVFSISAAFSQTSRSPVGTWEMTGGGRNPGYAFVTFNSDFTMNGYGMSLQSFGLFTLQGTWTMDAKGNIVGLYTESLNGSSFAGSFIGKAIAGRRIAGKTVASNGNSTLTGIPAVYFPDISGSWIVYVTEGKVTTPEFVTMSPSNVAPGVFIFSGNASGPSGAFLVSGVVLVTSKGKVVVLGESSFPDGATSFGSLTGSLNLRRQTGSLTGITDSGGRLRAKITR